MSDDTKPIKIYRREALLTLKENLPNRLVKRLNEEYAVRLYKERVCEKCEYLAERHSDTCDPCGAHLGSFMLFKEIEVKGEIFLSAPLGNPQPLLEALEEAHPEKEVHIKNVGPDVPIKPFKFTGEIRTYQTTATPVLRKKKRGVLKSPPRSGKTAILAKLTSELEQKTIILASQREWLVNFQETYVGSRTQPALTDINKKRVGFAKTLADFKKFDVCLVTYQTFRSPKGMKLLQRVKNMFAVVLVDEVQTANAPLFSKVVASFSCQYKIGCSGTPEKKSGADAVARNLFGPVIHEIQVPRLVPRVILTKTNFVCTEGTSRGPGAWTRLVSRHEEDKNRLRMIAELALKDVADGHMVLIPVTRVAVAKALAMAINKLHPHPDKIADAFVGEGLSKKQRDEIIENARRYKLKVIVGNISLLSTGINIPRASCLYERVTLTSNIPNCEQRISRILTPFAKKPQPLIRLFLDETDISKSCLRNEWWQCIVPKFKPEISSVAKAQLEAHLKVSRKDRDAYVEGNII